MTHKMEQDWNSSPKFWAVVPVLATFDVLKTAAYYHDSLGFAIDDDYTNDHWALLWADQCQLHLNLDPKAAETATGQKIMICVPGIDDLYESHKALGADLVAQLENKPTGLRQYTVRDPTGYHLIFHSHIETIYRPWKVWKDQQS